MLWHSQEDSKVRALESGGQGSSLEGMALLGDSKE